MLGITCSMEFDILEWKCHKRHSLLKQTRKRHKILVLCNDLMGHNNNINDFCGEICEISPNTPSKVAPKKGHFCMENRDISPIYEHIDLITLGGGLLENKQIPYEGLVIEASNAKNAVFSSKTQPL